MVVYADLAILLNFAVDLCLLLGTNRLSGYGASWKRVLPAAALGSLYGAACLMPGMQFLGNILWRIVVLLLMSVIAFGPSVSGLRRGVLFVVLSMAMGGLALGLGKNGFWSIAASGAVLCVLCFLGFRDTAGQTRYVQAVLTYRGKRMVLTALMDTGNLLRDPLTGQQLLLVSADVGQTLAGLTQEQLRDPVTALRNGELSGARLVPYRSVGQGSGMLLALPMEEVWIDGRHAGKLVAFAPNILSREKAYQALTGGAL